MEEDIIEQAFKEYFRVEFDAPHAQWLSMVEIAFVQEATVLQTADVLQPLLCLAARWLIVELSIASCELILVYWKDHAVTDSCYRQLAWDVKIFSLSRYLKISRSGRRFSFDPGTFEPSLNLPLRRRKYHVGQNTHAVCSLHLVDSVSKKHINDRYL